MRKKKVLSTGIETAIQQFQFEEQKIHNSCKIVAHFVNELPNSTIHFSFNSFINNFATHVFPFRHKNVTISC